MPIFSGGFYVQLVDHKSDSSGQNVKYENLRDCSTTFK